MCHPDNAGHHEWRCGQIAVHETGPRRKAEAMEFFLDYSGQPIEPRPPLSGYVVAYRESDILLASAFDTDVPVLAWAKIPE